MLTPRLLTPAALPDSDFDSAASRRTVIWEAADPAGEGEATLDAVVAAVVDSLGEGGVQFAADKLVRRSFGAARRSGVLRADLLPVVVRPSELRPIFEALKRVRPLRVPAQRPRSVSCRAALGSPV